MIEEDLAYYAVLILVIAGLFGVGFRRERRNRAAFRAFALRHGLEFQEDQPLKSVSAHGEGKHQGRDLYVGYVWVKPFTSGIGPTFGGRSVAVVALTVGSAARIDRQAPVVREFLAGPGSLSEKAVTYSFPKRHFQAITLEELEVAYALVRQVAATDAV